MFELLVNVLRLDLCFLKPSLQYIDVCKLNRSQNILNIHNEKRVTSQVQSISLEFSFPLHVVLILIGNNLQINDVHLPPIYELVWLFKWKISVEKFHRYDILNRLRERIFLKKQLVLSESV